ncbi:hypothetical protein HanRHA438_Chr08g0358961 [Helianthus annuus]|nr:hypothetical protein HanRHA438_Chr08g0358961 [Helianthus annuus]
MPLVTVHRFLYKASSPNVTCVVSSVGAVVENHQTLQTSISSVSYQRKRERNRRMHREKRFHGGLRRCFMAVVLPPVMAIVCRRRRRCIRQSGTTAHNGGSHIENCLLGF